MRTIEDVLEEMIGASYIMTRAQIQEIKEIHKNEKREAKSDCQKTFEAGRKHDAIGIRQILMKYSEV